MTASNVIFNLDYFTTQINQAPETNAVVDIGYHYVATDAYGNPLDSNGDGIPDYLEDPIGNGLDNPGETPWAWPPAITCQPASQIVAQGASATLAVTATGTPPPSYQWQLNGAAIAGATSSNYSIPSVQPANAGNYSVVVGNIAGWVASSNAIVGIPVQFSISFTNQYVNLTNVPLVPVQKLIPIYSRKESIIPFVQDRVFE